MATENKKGFLSQAYDMVMEIEKPMFHVHRRVKKWPEGGSLIFRRHLPYGPTSEKTNGKI